MTTPSRRNLLDMILGHADGPGSVTGRATRNDQFLAAGVANRRRIGLARGFRSGRRQRFPRRRGPLLFQ